MLDRNLKIISDIIKEQNAAAIIGNRNSDTRAFSFELLANDFKNKKIMILVPDESNFNFFINEVNKNKNHLSFSDFKFITYEELLNYSVKELMNINSELILMDQFNNIGGLLWNNIFDIIKENNKDIKFLGISNSITKASGSLNEINLTSPGELFHDKVVKEIRLEDILVDESEKLPYYVGLNGVIEEKINELKDILNHFSFDNSKMIDIQMKLDMLNQELDELSYYKNISKYIKEPGKYIIFCENEKDLIETKQFIDTLTINNDENINNYFSMVNLSYINEEECNNFFNKDDSGIKFLYTIDKYNIHNNLNNIDGVILSKGSKNTDEFYKYFEKLINKEKEMLLFDLGESRQNLLTELMVVAKKYNKEFHYENFNVEYLDAINNIKDNISENLNDFDLKIIELYEKLVNKVSQVNLKFSDGKDVHQWLNQKDVRVRLCSKASEQNKYCEKIIDFYNIKPKLLSFNEKIDECYSIILKLNSSEEFNFNTRFSDGKSVRHWLRGNKKKIMSLVDKNEKYRKITEFFSLKNDISDEEKKKELADSIRINGRQRALAPLFFSDGTGMYDWQKKKSTRAYLMQEIIMNNDEDASLILRTYVRLTYEKKIKEILNSKEKIRYHMKKLFSDGTFMNCFLMTNREEIISRAANGDVDSQKVVDMYKLNEYRERLPFKDRVLISIDCLSELEKNEEAKLSDYSLKSGFDILNFLNTYYNEFIRLSSEESIYRTVKEKYDYYKLRKQRKLETRKKEFLEYIQENGIKNLPSSIKFLDGMSMSVWWNGARCQVLADKDITSKKIQEIYNSVIRLDYNQKMDEMLKAISDKKDLKKLSFSDGTSMYYYYYVRKPRFIYYAYYKKTEKEKIIDQYFQKNSGVPPRQDYLEQYKNEKKEVYDYLQKYGSDILDLELASGIRGIRSWLRRHRYRLIIDKDPLSSKIVRELVIPNFKDKDGEDLIIEGDYQQIERKKLSFEDKLKELYQFYLNKGNFTTQINDKFSDETSMYNFLVNNKEIILELYNTNKYAKTIVDKRGWLKEKLSFEDKLKELYQFYLNKGKFPTQTNDSEFSNENSMSKFIYKKDNKKKIIELSTTNEYAKFIAQAKGWLDFEEAKENFEQHSEFNNLTKDSNKKEKQKMIESYTNYIEKFNNLDIDDKKREIVNNFNDLFNLLYTYNNHLEINKDLLPVFKSYETEDEFLNLLFTYIISFKEENAKLIKYINENINS